MERVVFEPDNFQQLAKAWLLHAKKFDEKHEAASRRYERCRWWVGVPAAVLQPVVALGIVTNLIEGPDSPAWLKAIAIIATLLSTGLVGLQTFGDFARRAEGHRLARSRFKAIIQELELEMPGLKTPTTAGASGAEDRDVLRRRLDGIRERMGKARDEAPNVPPDIDLAVETAWEGARGRVDLVPDRAPAAA
jgi:hypothetical protein